MKYNGQFSGKLILLIPVYCREMSSATIAPILSFENPTGTGCLVI